MMLAPEETNMKPQLLKATQNDSNAKTPDKVSLSDEEPLSGDEDAPSNKSSWKKAAKNSRQKVLVPGAADILLGRGKPFQSHQGNQLMLQLVDQFRENYLKADRKGKHIIIEHVLTFIKERGGRFLMRVDYESYWVEVKRSISYRKVGHAFRSKARRSKNIATPLSPVMKGLGSGATGAQNLMGGHNALAGQYLLGGQGLDMVFNSPRTSKFGQMMGAGMGASSSPLLRIPPRMSNPANPGLQRTQDSMLKEIIARDRTMGAHQDALAMRRQFHGVGNNFNGFNGNNAQNNLLGSNVASMPSMAEELFLLERMQGMSQTGNRGSLNSNGLLQNPFGMLNGGQGPRFSNQFL